MLSRIRNIYIKYPITISTTLLFFFCSLYITYDSPEYETKMGLAHILWALVNTTLLFSILYLISRIPRLGVILVLFLSLVLTVDVTHVAAYDTRIMFGGVASMLETNMTEAMGMSRHLLLFGIPVFIVCFCCSFFMQRELKKARLPISIIVALALICAVLLPIALVIKDVRRSDHRKNTFSDYPLFVIQEVLGYRYPIGYGSLFITAAYLEETRKMNQFVGKPKTLPAGVELEPLSEKPQTLYVLIGESSLRSNYSLYGYDIPTTPFLDSMLYEKALYKVDAVSPACLTRDAIKMTLSFATPHNQDSFYENYNAVELANLAGYNTYWISNQDKLGVDDSNIGFIAASSNHIEFHNYKKDDIELIDIVDSLYDNKKSQVFFIHLKGSHLPYFDKSDKQDDVLLHSFNKDNEILFSFNKSILHTDRVIEHLYDNISSKKDSTASLVYYYSDHGEIIGTGHGFLNHGIEQFLIPFIAIPHNFSLNWEGAINPYLNRGGFNSVNFINVFAQSIGYSLSSEFKEKAKKDAPFYYHVDRKVYNFSDIKK